MSVRSPGEVPVAPGFAPLTVHVLGSGSGCPTARRDTTALLISAPDGWTLIDCPGSVVHEIAKRGVGPGRLQRLILTHNHVDHVYGFPHLVHAMAVHGDCSPLTVHAPSQTLETVRAMLEIHQLTGPWYPELMLEPIAMQPEFELAADGPLRIRTTPADHGRDTVAVRVEAAHAALGLSSDTRPSAAVATLCRNVDLLLHDCGGLHADIETFGAHHSSARQAGEIAAAAEAQGLVLIHVSAAAEADEAALAVEAASSFDGPVRVAHDGDLFRIPTRPASGAGTGRCILG